jgi:hypothetical protein
MDGLDSARLGEQEEIWGDPHEDCPAGESDRAEGRYQRLALCGISTECRHGVLVDRKDAELHRRPHLNVSSRIRLPIGTFSGVVAMAESQKGEQWTRGRMEGGGGEGLHAPVEMQTDENVNVSEI